MRDETILITGSAGCIGAWALRHLINEGANFVATDLTEDLSRPSLLLTDEEISKVNWQQLDVTDTEAVKEMVAKNDITHIVHLAGLQVPFCKANPALGASVNVVGTVNILEAARHNKVQGISYASSLGTFGPPENYPVRPVPDDAVAAPDTLYGVYKYANEETARIFWQDWQVGSIGLRPYNVYGVARDQGMTADIAKAILAVAAGKPFHIRYDGEIALQHASDVSRIFIDCARANYDGATICNLRNDVISVSDFMTQLKGMYPQAQITCETGNNLPYPADLDDSGLRSILGSVPHIPLEDGIRQDFETFSALIEQGRIDLSQLER